MNRNLSNAAYLFFLNFGIVFLLMFLLDAATPLRFGFLSSAWLFSLCVFSFTLGVVFRSETSSRGNFVESIFESSQYFFLSILLVLAVNSFLKLDFISARNLHLTVLGIAFGFLTFYRNRERVERELENEKFDERAAEERRSRDFAMKFPFWNRIWGVRRLVKWMYVEGWSFSIPFVLITLVFIAIKIGMPLVYTGSYIDETIHLMSGVSFFKTGHFPQLYLGQEYIRGAYVSFFVGLFLSTLGKNLFVAKLVPAILGIFNFFILYFLSRRVLVRKRYILLILALYLISPWVIFNHFYIRMYVFYEFFILSSLLILFNLNDSLRHKNFVNSSIWLLFICALNIVAFFLSNDQGAYIVLSIPLMYLFVFLLESKISLGKKVLIFFIVAGILFFIFNIPNKLDFLLNTEFENSKSGGINYDFVFFGINTLLTIFFFVSLSLISRTNRNNNFFLIISAFILIAHLLSNPSLQLVRVVMYFLPVYYLVVVYSVSQITKNKIFYLFVFLVLISIVASNYPSNYFSGPYIPGEVSYKDYKAVSDYISKNYKGREVLVSSQPQINLFLGTRYSEIYLARNNKVANYNKSVEFFNESENLTRSALTHVVVIDTFDQFKQIVDHNENTVILIDTNFIDWLTPETLSFMKKEFIEIDEYAGLKLYKRR